MKAPILALIFAFATPAFAQGNLEQEAREVMMALHREAPRLTPAQESEISQHLNAIRDVIYPGYNPGYPGQASYACVSRDNDGRAPYALAIRNGLNVTRLAGGTFNTENDCVQALNTSRYIAGATLMCVSRDNDGRAPFSLASLGNQITRLPRTLTNSVGDCNGLLSSLRPSPNGQVVYCTSRDNDGRAPFQAVALTPTTGAVQGGTEIFNTINECNAFIGQ
jgi:hypothetical protein